MTTLRLYFFGWGGKGLALHLTLLVVVEGSRAAAEGVEPRPHAFEGERLSLSLFIYVKG